MRIHHFRPDELTPEQEAVYYAINNEQRRGAHSVLPSSVQLCDDEGRLQGPFNAMLLHPPTGKAVQEVGRVLRFETSFTTRCREIAILIVAAYEKSDFEWAAHAAIGRSIGLADQLGALARQEEVRFADAEEDAVAGLTRLLVRDVDLDEPTYGNFCRVAGRAAYLRGVDARRPVPPARPTDAPVSRRCSGGALE